MMSFLKAARILLFRLTISLYYFLPSKSRKLDKKEKMSPCDTGMKMIVKPPIFLPHFKRCFNLEKVPEGELEGLFSWFKISSEPFA